MVICTFNLYRYPTSALGKVFGGFTMFAGLLVIAFPITILSINMSELYDDYKSELERKKATSSADTSSSLTPLDTLRSKVSQNSIDRIKSDKAEQLKKVLKDLEKSDAQVNEINKVMENLILHQDDIRISIQGLLGRVLKKSEQINKTKILEEGAVKEEAKLM